MVSAKAWIGPIIPDCLDVSCAKRERKREEEKRIERRRERKKEKGGGRERERLVRPP